MRILFVIPHYFGAGEAYYGSSDATRRLERIDALRGCINSLHLQFSSPPYILHRNWACTPVKTPQHHDITVIICTFGTQHLLNDLDIDSACYTHQSSTIDTPLHLGFFCHTILKQQLGNFDWYCYMEDDLAINDSYFITKLELFNQTSGNQQWVAFPHRYELSTARIPKKIYIDGELWPDNRNQIARMLLPGAVSELQIPWYPNDVIFTPAANPHSGCFFLNASQFELLVSQPWFGQPLNGLAGPLESAATLPIMALFNIYKTSLDQAHFFEICHGSHSFTKRMIET